MRSHRTGRGPFAEKPFFSPEDFETICTSELEKHGLYPSTPAPIRIDRFVEKRFGVRPSYEELPGGLLGFTRFGASGVEEIVVAKALDDEGTQVAERRLRTTLAHESGHGLLHAHLFALGARPAALFGDGLASDAPKILCREGDLSGVTAPKKKPSYRWWEFQANQAMAVLLLPRGLVEKALETVLHRGGILGAPVLPGFRRAEAARLIADTFEVNPIVARFRLEGLYPPGAERQLTL